MPRLAKVHDQIRLYLPCLRITLARYVECVRENGECEKQEKEESNLTGILASGNKQSRHGVDAILADFGDFEALSDVFKRPRCSSCCKAVRGVIESCIACPLLLEQDSQLRCAECMDVRSCDSCFRLVCADHAESHDCELHLEIPDSVKLSFEGQTLVQYRSCGWLTMTAASCLGSRKTMEDGICYSFELENHPETSAFALCDGTGGPEACLAVLEELIGVFEACGELSTDNITEGLLSMDSRIRKRPGLPEICATTLSFALVTRCTETQPDEYKGRIGKVLAGNCGDSPILLVHDDELQVVSVDHTPKLESESTRIYQAGMEVFEERVNGCLAWSRGYGGTSEILPRHLKLADA